MLRLNYLPPFISNFTDSWLSTDRHLMRHKQKDEEAGGIGLGVVETRKRSWRDVEGNLVTKRPSLPERKPSDEQDFFTSYSPELSTRDDECHFITQDEYSNQVLSRQGAAVRSLTTSIEDAQSVLPDCFLNLSSYPGSLWSGTTLETPTRDDVSVQGTGKLPCTDLWSFAYSTLLGRSPNAFQTHYAPFSSQEWLLDVASASNLPSGDLSYPSDAAFTNFDDVWRSSSDTISMASHDDSLGSFYDLSPGASNGRSFDLLDAGARQSSEAWDMPSQFSPRPYCTGHCSTSSAAIPPPSSLAIGQSSFSSSIPRPASSSNLEPHESSSVRFTASKWQLPVIDHVSWNRALDIVFQSAVPTPDGKLLGRDHPLLSYRALQNYCDLFFIHFNTNFPMIHRATFTSTQTEPLLLLAVLLLGATYSSEDSYQLAIAIHNKIRIQVLQDYASLVSADLSLIQAIMLIECFGMLRAGQQHDGMTHLCHGLVIKYVSSQVRVPVGSDKFSAGS